MQNVEFLPNLIRWIESDTAEMRRTNRALLTKREVKMGCMVYGPRRSLYLAAWKGWKFEKNSLRGNISGANILLVGDISRPVLNCKNDIFHAKRRPEIVSEPKTENDADAYQLDSISMSDMFLYSYNLSPSWKTDMIEQDI